MRSKIASRFRLYLVIGIFFLPVIACSFTNILNSNPTPTPAAENPATSTPSSPSGGLTSQPTKTASACYLSSWSATGMGDLIVPLLTANNIQNAKYTGSSGSLVMTLSADGKLTLQAQQYHNLYSGNMAFLTVTVDVLVDGSGTGNYTLDSAGSILLSNSSFGGISYSAKVGGISAISPTPVDTIVPALQNLPAGQAYNLGSTCQGDVLTFDSGTSSSPLIFDRNK